MRVCFTLSIIFSPFFATARPSEDLFQKDLDRYLSEQREQGILGSPRSFLPTVAVVVGQKQQPPIYARFLSGKRSTQSLSSEELTGADPRLEAALFDLASLTKVYTTLLYLRLWEKGLVPGPSEKVGPLWEIAFKNAQDVPKKLPAHYDRVEIRHLLMHTASLRSTPEYIDYFKGDSLKSFTWANLLLDPDNILSVDVGTQTRYSDLGPMILGKLIEGIRERTLAGSMQEFLLEPAGLRYTHFYVHTLTRDQRIISTSPRYAHFFDLPARHFKRDEWARLLGGLGGHAGLVASALDVAKLCGLIAQEWALFSQPISRSAFFGEQSFKALFQWPSPEGDAWERALGFQIEHRDLQFREPKDRLAHQKEVGHTGFTGTSMWIDLETGYYSVILTNRTGSNLGASPRGIEALKDLRRSVSDLVARHLVFPASQKE